MHFLEATAVAEREIAQAAAERAQGEQHECRGDRTTGCHQVIATIRISYRIDETVAQTKVYQPTAALSGSPYTALQPSAADYDDRGWKTGAF